MIFIKGGSKFGGKWMDLGRTPIVSRVRGVSGQDPRKLNSFVYLALSFACNFAQESCNYTEKNVSRPATLIDAVGMHPLILVL